MITAKILRIQYQEVQTLGNLFVFDGAFELFHCKTLELPWKNNERRVSCIPTSAMINRMYKVAIHDSPKFNTCFWIKDVPDRSEVLIHVGNFYTDILGCILPGESFTDINQDGWLDVTYSQKTINHLVNILPGIFNLEICGEPYR